MTIFWSAVFDLKRSNPKDPNWVLKDPTLKIQSWVLKDPTLKIQRGSGYSIPTSENI
jgi:hypothetical protein